MTSPQEADFTRPNGARVYDCLLGGKDNFAADRDAADRIEQMFPGMRELVRLHREFKIGAGKRPGRVQREGVVRLLARRGVRQFIDAGCGFPLKPWVHEVAREEQADARVAYADADVLAVAHLRALCGEPGVAVDCADAARPGDVLAAPELREVIDLGEPVGLLLGGVLGSVPASVARDAVAGYASRLARGSAVAITCVSYRDQEAGNEAAKAYREMTGGAWYSHSLAVIAGFFEAGGLVLEQGWPADVRCWPMLPRTVSGDVSVIGGVGRLP